MTGTTPLRPVQLPERDLGAYGRRRLRPIHAVAVLCSLLAAFAVYTLFDRYRLMEGPGQGDRALIASVDLRIGNPATWAERGEAAARADLKDGVLQWQVFGPEPAPGSAEAARAARWKAAHRIQWVRKGREATPLTLAYAEAYNRVMQAEIEKRFGPDLVERLLQEQPRVTLLVN